ncbi:MAG: iron-sulfur cluster assembly scaffold protein [Planctomycetota bacterium]
MKADGAAMDRTPEADDPWFGRMNDPSGEGLISGPCGDTMEFYLYIRNDVIEDVKYYTDGCGNTRACGRAAARRAKGRTVTDALSVSAGEIIRSGECDPEGGRHCAILAVSTLYWAAADYLLKP